MKRNEELERGDARVAERRLELLAALDECTACSVSTKAFPQASSGSWGPCFGKGTTQLWWLLLASPQEAEIEQLKNQLKAKTQEVAETTKAILLS